MAYNKTVWVNGEEPAINAENLNKIEDALAAHDTDISDLKSEIAQGSGLTNDIKSALMNVVEHIGAWTDGNAQVYVENLRGALYPPANLVSISAVYTQGSKTVYDTDSLDSLKSDLVVTANYDNGTSEAVSSYTLSGSLTRGTSTITATYGGKTATFTVEVTHYTIPPLYNWDLTTSLTDTIEGQIATLGGSATQDANGVTFANTDSYIELGDLYAKNRTIEVDVADSGSLAIATNGRLIALRATWGTGYDTGAVFQKTTSSWTIYTGAWVTASTVLGLNDIKGQTVTLKITSSQVRLYIGDTLVATGGTWNPKGNGIRIGCDNNSINGLTVTAVRIYENSEA